MNIRSFLFVSLATCSVMMLSACVDHDGQQSQITWKQNQQLILVLSSDWNVNHGVLFRFQYQQNHWVSVGHSFPVSLGKNGVAWDATAKPLKQDAVIKWEGDMRSPAGMFKIGHSFGYAQKINSAYPYLALTKDDYCIDNNQSPYYNQIINQNNVDFDVAKYSTEPMRRDIHLNGDQLYKLGFTLQYNPQNKPKAGSCIFVHLRPDTNATTAGCTSMEEDNMKQILGWLNEKNNPVFVLLPMDAYQEKEMLWDLPKIQ